MPDLWDARSVFRVFKFGYFPCSFEIQKDFQTAEFKAKDRRKILRDRQGGSLFRRRSDQRLSSVCCHAEEEARYLLQIHNYEDVLGMIDLLPILSYPQIFQGAFTVDSIVKNLYEDYQSITKNECIITLKNQYPVPKRISYGFDQFYLTSYQDTTKLSIKIYSGELKYFYPNYKDYYYLPEEDTAIHKSVAFYVDKNYRTKAKAATCYSKRPAVSPPQHQVVVSPYFKLEYHDKITYFELTDEFIDNETDVKAYVMHVLSLLLMAK